MLPLADIHHLIETYGYGVIAGIVALEGMGIPVPGETALIVAAIYAQRTHHLTIGLVIAAAVAGAIVGDNTGFFIGREVGYRLVLDWAVVSRKAPVGEVPSAGV